MDESEADRHWRRVKPGLYTCGRPVEGGAAEDPPEDGQLGFKVIAECVGKGPTE